jgi:hypothetical protein
MPPHRHTSNSAATGPGDGRYRSCAAHRSRRGGPNIISMSSPTRFGQPPRDSATSTQPARSPEGWSPRVREGPVPRRSNSAHVYRPLTGLKRARPPEPGGLRQGRADSPDTPRPPGARRAMYAQSLRLRSRAVRRRLTATSERARPPHCRHCGPPAWPQTAAYQRAEVIACADTANGGHWAALSAKRGTSHPLP